MDNPRLVFAVASSSYICQLLANNSIYVQYVTGTVVFMNKLVKQQHIGRSIYEQAGKTTAYRS